MTTGEASVALGVSRDTVIRWCDEGILQHDRDGHVRRISLAVVMAKAKELQHA
jgi:excisionase family DNA binding protein